MSDSIESRNPGGIFFLFLFSALPSFLLFLSPCHFIFLCFPFFPLLFPLSLSSAFLFSFSISILGHNILFLFHFAPSFTLILFTNVILMTYPHLFLILSDTHLFSQWHTKSFSPILLPSVFRSVRFVQYPFILITAAAAPAS